MPNRVEFHPAAVREAADAQRWYAERSQLAAQRFADELDHVVAQLRLNPDRFPPHLQGTRRCVLRRFPYIVVFRTTLDGLEVIAVAHARRRPGYWQSRM